MTNVENKMTAQFKFMGYREDEILFDVQPIVHDTIEFEISIRPKNSMTAIYDLVETPTISLPVHPVEDAYITTDTPYNSINTGDDRSMLIGRDIKGEHRGLIKFDLSTIDPKLYIKSAKLRIYYSNLIPNTMLNLYTANGEWSEYSVTYLNKPNVKDFLTSEYVINEDESYIEFNVSNIVLDWIKGIANDGFYLLSNDIASTFRTRESSYSPVLFVDYKDFSYKLSYSKSEFEVQVKALSENDIEFDVEVDETYTTNDVEWEVFAHDPNHIYTDDIEWEITSVEITPTQTSEDIEWEVTSVKSDFNQIQWEVAVPKYDSDNNIEFDITPSYSGENVIEWEFTVKPPSSYTDADNTIEFEIRVNQYSDESGIEWEIDILGLYVSSENTIEFDITVNEYSDDSDIEFEIDVYEVDDSSIEFEIEIIQDNENSDVEFEIGVWGYYDSDIEFEVYVPHSDIEFEVIPVFNDENGIEFEVVPRVPYVADIEFNVEVLQNRNKKYSYVFIL